MAKSLAVLRVAGHPQAGGKREAVFGGAALGVQLADQLPGALADLFFVHFCRAEYQKFVPAYAADNIRIAKIFADDLGHLKNGSVAGRVPQSVVNAFKVVKIDHKHGVALGIVGDFCMSVEHIQHPRGGLFRGHFIAHARGAVPIGLGAELQLQGLLLVNICNDAKNINGLSLGVGQV